jgi:hypothetical protein
LDVTELEPEARELRDLLNEWDPIGVYRDPANSPNDLDEYDDLNGPVMSRLRQGSGAQEIGDFLLTELRSRYGIDPDRAWVFDFAQQVKAWFDGPSPTP